ncbi:MAG: hypothetical protein C5B58_01045 [Acidobacteria bacterium]|nr:MAG: hypothetical protein C5B58_01045 [Acidobacteriota bacterium]
MNDLEVNESRPASFWVVNDIRRSRVAMRPGTVKFIAPKLMRASKFRSNGFHHPSCQRAVV